jgi:putative transcriptional regulator
MSRAADSILRGAQEALEFAQGDRRAGRAHRVQVPRTVDVKRIRSRLGLTQTGFAARFGFSVAAVRDWEQHRRQPDVSARVLLTVIDHEPEAVERALRMRKRA